MKAIYIAEPGGPEKLIFGDRPDPEAGAGEVIVRVRGTALNHADLSIRAGRSPTGGLPRILGLDIAGEVASLGPGVTGWSVGDRVVVENRVKCGTCTPCALGRDEYCERQRRLGGELDGGHAQYCKVPAVNLQRIPDGMTFEEAATLPLAGHTAWHCLIERVQLQPWEDVLIQAVGSGVGQLRSPDRQGHRRPRHRDGGKRLEARESQGARRRRRDQLHHHAEVQPARQGAHQWPRRGRGVRLCRGHGLGREPQQPEARGQAGHHGDDLGEPDPVQSVPDAGPAIDAHGQWGTESPQLCRHDAHGGLWWPAWRGGPHVRLGEAAVAHEVMAGRDFFGKLVLRVP